MEKHVLSKSTFIRGVQCLKSLYLNKKRPFLRDRIPKERLLVFQRGHRVGELAQELFPGGINMSPGHPAAYRKALIKTRQKIDEGYPVLYEAAFQHDGVLIFIDILAHTGSGWHAYEVKSSAGISDTYRMDAALQYYVICGSGIDLQGISLIHLDREYVKDGEINPKSLFKIINITDEALTRQEYIIKQIEKEKETLKLDQSPKIGVGEHCREPYDCDFIGHCWKNEPVMAAKEPIEHFDKEPAKSKLLPVSKVAYLKILSMRQAIPAYDRTSPYQEIPYAFSLSINGNSVFRLFSHQSNPEPQLIDALKKQLAGITTVIIYGQGNLCRKTLADLDIIDLENFVLPDSEMLNLMDGDSLLDKILSYSFSKKSSAYTSDAVCTHHYLEDAESAGVKAAIEEYAREWVKGIEGLFMLLTND